MSESEQEKILRLIDILIRKTHTGAIQWERRATRDDDVEYYEYSTTDSTVSISNDGPRGYVRFVVRNAEAVVIGELGVTEFTPAEIDQPLIELHNAARRRVLKIDETLDAIIAELEEDEPPF